MNSRHVSGGSIPTASANFSREAFTIAWLQVMQVLVVQRAQVNHTCLPYVMLRFNRHGGSREPVWEHQWAGRSLTSYQRTCWILVPQFRTAVGNDACSRGHAGHRSDRGDTEYSSKNRAFGQCIAGALYCGAHSVCIL